MDTFLSSLFAIKRRKKINILFFRALCSSPKKQLTYQHAAVGVAKRNIKLQPVHITIICALKVDCDSTAYQSSPTSLRLMLLFTKSPPWLPVKKPVWFSRGHRTKSQDSHLGRCLQKILTDSHAKGFSLYEITGQELYAKGNKRSFCTLKETYKMHLKYKSMS